MRHRKRLIGAVILLGAWTSDALAQQIGQYVPIQAGSDVDHALSEINAATDPAQKLGLIQKFADGIGKEGKYPLLANGLFVDYYLGRKNYDKAFEYGDKVFELDQDNFQNAINMVRAAGEVRAGFSGFGIRESGNGHRGDGLSASAEYAKNARSRERAADEKSQRCRNAAPAFGLLRRKRRAAGQGRELREEGAHNAGV